MSQSQKKQRVVEPLSGCEPEIGRWLWALEDTRQRTEQSLEGIGAEAIDLAFFRDMDVEDFRRLHQMAGHSITPEWVLHHLIQHEAEHRGQMAKL